MEELLEVGKEIADNFKGLPNAIIAIVGFLEKLTRTRIGGDKLQKV